jgi:hypothetical protein
MEIVATALRKEDYVSSVTTNSGGGEEYQNFKSPLVEVYRQRYVDGRDLWTGEKLVDRVGVAEFVV